MDNNTYYLAIETKPNNYFPLELLDLNISPGYNITKIEELDNFTLKYTKKEILDSIKEANLLDITDNMELVVIFNEKDVIRKSPVLTKDLSFDMWNKIKNSYQDKNFLNKIYNFLNGKVDSETLNKLKEIPDQNTYLTIISNIPYFTQRKLYFYLYER